MKIKLAVTVAAALLSMASISATVDYQHPEVSIVAVGESLDSVLKAVGKEMNLSVTTPIGINLEINCNIQNQPIKRAFKNLLGELSYSLVWGEDGERLTGLVILAGDDEEARVSLSTTGTSSDTSSPQVVSMPDASDSRQNATRESHSYDDPEMAEREAELAFEQLEQQDRMAEERAEQNAEMEKILEEEDIAHKDQVVKDRAERESRMSDLAESLGLPPIQR